MQIIEEYQNHMESHTGNEMRLPFLLRARLDAEKVCRREVKHIVSHEITAGMSEDVLFGQIHLYRPLPHM